MSGQSLLAFLRSGSFTQKPHSEAVSATIGALAKAALEVRKLTTQGALNAGFAGHKHPTPYAGQFFPCPRLGVTEVAPVDVITRRAFVIQCLDRHDLLDPTGHR